MTTDAKPQTQEAKSIKTEGKAPAPKAPEPVSTSLRDFLAAHALQGMLAQPGGAGNVQDTARQAYAYADAMLAARPKGEA